jgi:hypothetical protein
MKYIFMHGISISVYRESGIDNMRGGHLGKVSNCDNTTVLTQGGDSEQVCEETRNTDGAE